QAARVRRWRRGRRRWARRRRTRSVYHDVAAHEWVGVNRIDRRNEDGSVRAEIQGCPKVIVFERPSEAQLVRDAALRRAVIDDQPSPFRSNAGVIARASEDSGDPSRVAAPDREAPYITEPSVAGLRIEDAEAAR